ncbi:TadE-like protein [Micromonospora pisi]|uniref:TadE-like protein n=1 Tax=Micromonospora pisi TaxID=589240 RepID=A0A495JJK9_9ACTN|nr:TadE/TadG family type IV pilus assembly protein [Micromonospora pisi]RKR89001.1 TadE-like protein [Micromonospora pisi]
MSWLARRRDSRGSVSVETAVVAPAFIGLLLLAAMAGRTALADEAVGAAAHDAARAASIARSPDEARQGAAAAVTAQLAWSDLTCSSITIALDGIVGNNETSLDEAFDQLLGSDVSVRATVSCLVVYEDLSMPALDMIASDWRESTFVSPLDRYRSRSGGDT